MSLLAASLAVRQSSGPGPWLLLVLLRKPVSSCSVLRQWEKCLSQDPSSCLKADWHLCMCVPAYVCPFMAMFGLLTSSFWCLSLLLLLPQGSRQEVGSRSEAIVKGKPLASSCYERKCIQMCFLYVHPPFCSLIPPLLLSPLSPMWQRSSHCSSSLLLPLFVLLARQNVTNYLVW